MPDEIMDYLGNAEGKVVHHNAGESDITSPYGIYKKQFPTAEIFDILDKIASNLGINEESYNWTDYQIATINEAIVNDEDAKNKIRESASNFYHNMSKPAKIEFLPEDAKLAMFSLFVNSPRNAGKSLQMALNTFISLGKIDNPELVVDGAPGNKTVQAIKKINNEDGLLLESYLLLSMSSLYAKLAVKNPDKYLKYLNGWNNRLKKLSKI